jgi:hypothetical protein
MKIYKGVNTFGEVYIKNIEPCCSEAKELFDFVGIDIEKDDDEEYITHTDWDYEYGWKYKIKFRYCPFCGEQIFIV